MDKLVSEMEGKDIEEVISQGLGKLASVPAGGGGGGGGGGAAAGGGGGGAAGGALGCTAGLGAVAAQCTYTGFEAAPLRPAIEPRLGCVCAALLALVQRLAADPHCAVGCTAGLGQ